MKAAQRWQKAVGIFALSFAITPAIYAQGLSGDLTGTVFDPAGSLVANAAVEAVQTGTGAHVAVHSGAAGTYRFVNLPAGNYTLSVNGAGFRPASVKDVTIDVSKISTVNVTLQVGQQASSIDITDASANIDTTTATIGGTFDQNQMLDMPGSSMGSSLAPGILNLSLLNAGVASNGGLQIGTGPSVGGLRPRSNSFAVDGADNNNRANTGFVVLTPNDATQELTVLQNQFGAEYGHGGGGQFKVLLKTGANDVHGSLYEYFENRNLNALDQIFANAGTRTQPRFDSNRFGGTVGGPIRRNKLFYFANLEYSPTGQASSPGGIFSPTAAGYTALSGISGLSKVNLGVLQQYAPAAPAASGSVVVKGTTIPVGILPVVAANYINDTDAVVSGDYNASSYDQLHVRYVLNHSGQIDNATSLPAFFVPITVASHLASITENHTFTPNLIAEYRISYTRFLNDTPSSPLKFPGLDVFPNIDIGDLNGLQLGPDGGAPQFVASNTYQLAENLTWIHGRHTMHAGFEEQLAIAPTRFSQNVRGDYEYSSLNLFLQDITPDQVAQRTVGNPTYYGNQHMYAGFVNDTIRLTPRLTVDLGLRYEHASVQLGEMKQALNAIASVPGLFVFNAPKPQYLNFAPRVGIAWSPGTNAATVVRAGFGIADDTLYDNIGINSQPPQFATNVIVSNSAGGFLANGGIVSSAPPVTAAQARAQTATYIPDLRTPYAVEWNIGVQHVFAKSFTFEMRYVGTHGVHLDMQTRPTNFTPVTAANSLPTYLSSPGQAALNALPITLTQLQSQATKVLPQYAAAGFTNAGLTEYSQRGNSIYHGLATQLTKRYSDHLQFVAAWTWSHLIDDSTEEFFTTLLSPRRPQDSQNIGAERADSPLDRRHRITFGAVYNLPFGEHSNGFVKNVIGNWSLAPQYTYESPEMVTALSQLDANLNGDFFSDRAIVNPSGTAGVGSGVTPLTNSAGQTVAYLATNPNARYIAAGAGAYANGGRDTLAGRPIDNIDLNVLKNVHASERLRVQFSAQFFNAVNHPQFTPAFINRVDNPIIPNNSGGIFNYVTPGSATFNKPEAVYGSNPRNIQLALKFLF